MINDGTNVICGGTNAAGIGFAGGPLILGKNGEIVEIRTGVPRSRKKRWRGLARSRGPGSRQRSEGSGRGHSAFT